MRTIHPSSLDRLRSDWDFEASRPSLRIRRLRLQHRLTARRRAPDFTVVRAPVPAPRWNLLFLFSPTGTLDPDQHEILDRVGRLDGLLIVVIALPPAAPLPDALGGSDAIVRKDLPGFDFSGYALGLQLIAQRSPGAYVYVQNDSVFGPFGDVDGMLARAPWDLAGFMGSADVENHICSFAFGLRDVSVARLAALSDVLSTRWCYDSFGAVVVSQETRLASVASRSMTVGAFYHLPVRPALPSLRQRIHIRIDRSAAERYPLDLRGNATLGAPFELLDRGFPFLKRSLVGKLALLGHQGAARERLAGLGWAASV